MQNNFLSLYKALYFILVSFIICLCTDKKENKIFLIYKEIQSGTVPKLYMRKGFLICEEMRKYFPIYGEAVRLCNCSILNFPIYEENLSFFFVSGTVWLKSVNSLKMLQAF
jgi:hypothetical protein